MANRQSLLRLVKSLIAAYALSAIFLFLLALALWKWNLSEMMINGAMVFIYIISAAVGGFYLGKKQKERKKFQSF